MTTLKRDFLKKLLLTTPDNGVVCAAFLKEKGFSYENLKGYVHSGYLDQLGRGAYCKHDNKPTVAAGVSALNRQLALPVHIGGKTALARNGYVHFVPFRELPSSLYCAPRVAVPAWFTKHYHGRFTLTRTNLFPDDDGVKAETIAGFEVMMSVPERAILEMLHLVPRKQMLNEVYQLLEMMTSLRVSVVQNLLTHCSSVKAKRLFLMLAEEAGHPWLKRLDLSSVDLGSGCRMIDKGGSLERKYNVVVKPWREI